VKFLRTSRLVASFVALPLAAYFFAGLLPNATRTAHADENCAITPADLDAVTSAHAASLTAELTARKALLARTLSCAKADAQTLRDTLTNLTVSDDEKNLQSQLADKLNDALNYYDLEIARIDGSGIAGTKAIARETFTWRAANYDPLAGQVANFTFWVENQNLFSVANERLSQMRNIVSFIVQVAPNSDLQTAFANAETFVRNANDENVAAKNALLRSLPPTQSLIPIQQSLQSLSDAYKKFFEVSTIVQTLLPSTSK
jgi:hypothetical protein